MKAGKFKTAQKCSRYDLINFSNEGRELLMRMLEVFVLKFKSIVKIQLPILVSRWEQKKQEPAHGVTEVNMGRVFIVLDLSNVFLQVKAEPAETLDALNTTQGIEKDTKPRFGAQQTNTYNVADYRSLVKTLVSKKCS